MRPIPNRHYSTIDRCQESLLITRAEMIVVLGNLASVYSFLEVLDMDIKREADRNRAIYEFAEADEGPDSEPVGRDAKRSTAWMKAASSANFIARIERQRRDVYKLLVCCISKFRRWA